MATKEKRTIAKKASENRRGDSGLSSSDIADRSGRCGAGKYSIRTRFHSVKLPALVPKHESLVTDFDNASTGYSSDVINQLIKITKVVLRLKGWESGLANLSNDPLQQTLYLSSLINEWAIENTSEGLWALTYDKTEYKFKFFYETGPMGGVTIRMKGICELKQSKPDIYKVFFDIISYFFKHNLNGYHDLLEGGMVYEHMTNYLGELDKSEEKNQRNAIIKLLGVYKTNGIAANVLRDLAKNDISANEVLSIIESFVPKKATLNYPDKIRQLFWETHAFIKKYDGLNLLRFADNFEGPYQDLLDNDGILNQDLLRLCWDWDDFTEEHNTWLNSSCNEIGIVPFLEPISISPGDPLPMKSMFPIHFIKLISKYWDVCRIGPIIKKPKQKTLLNILT